MLRMVELAGQAESAGADLVLFCEAAPTGVRITGDPERDLALGETIPGAYAERFRAMNAAALVVNGLADDGGAGGCIGGAFATDAHGAVVAALSPGVEDVLVVDVSSFAARAVWQEGAEQ